MLTLPTLTDLSGVIARCHRRLIARTLSRHGPQAGTTTAE